MTKIKSAYEELKEIGVSSLAIHRITSDLGIKASQRKIHYLLQDNMVGDIEDATVKHIVEEVIYNYKQLIINLKQNLCSI